MAPCGLVGSGGRFKEAEGRSKPKATPESGDLGNFTTTSGLAEAAVRSQLTESERRRLARGKGRSEPQHRGAETGRARWGGSPKTADGTSGLSERRLGAPAERKLGEPEGTKPQREMPKCRGQRRSKKAGARGVVVIASCVQYVMLK